MYPATQIETNELNTSHHWSSMWDTVHDMEALYRVESGWSVDVINAERQFVENQLRQFVDVPTQIETTELRVDGSVI